VSQARTQPELSVVIPAYNEAGRIAEPLRRIHHHLAGRGLSAEVVLVDDGSTDGTPDVVRRIAAELGMALRVLGSPGNRGKGHALRLGMTSARGRAVLMTDADLSTPIDELDRFLPWLRDGAQVVIGSRKMHGATIEVRQPLLREMMGRVFTFLTRLLIVRVSDVTCGFKLFTREAAHEVFSRLTLDDWSFDAEALFVARKLGYGIREVPVTWRDAAGTKVHRGRDAVRAGLGLARIRLNALAGRYALRGGRPAAEPAPCERQAERGG
jgi:dolichyl-phosphate beta-glucosyltransferase